jgi:NAD(P)H-hydrate epimerase
VLACGEPITEDAIANKRICETMNIPMLGVTDEEEITVSTAEADLIIDAIYGTGFHGELRTPVRSITTRINQSKAPVYALDIPSGLNGDTGEADPDTVRADGTIAFHRLKPAHADGSCTVYCGKIVCISIGIEEVLK